MPATLEDLNIVFSALDSCKSLDEIVRNTKIPVDIVREVMASLKKLGKVKEDYPDNYCPIDTMTQGVCNSCNTICKTLEG